MAHDRNGVLLSVGDTVLIECTITAIHNTQGEQYCNADLLTVESMPPTGKSSNISAINTQQTSLFRSKSKWISPFLHEEAL